MTIKARDSLDMNRRHLRPTAPPIDSEDQEDEEGLYPDLPADHENPEELYPGLGDNVVTQSYSSAGYLQTEDAPSSEDGDNVQTKIIQESKPDEEGRSLFNRLGFLFLFMLPILVALLGHGTSSVLSPSQQLDILFSDHQSWLPEEKFVEIKKNFLQKLEDKKQSDPLSIFFLTESSYANVRNFSLKLVQGFARSSEGEHLLYNRGQSSSSISTTTRAVLVENFTDYSWNEAKMFMEFCDNDNSPHPFTLFVFIGQGKCDLKHPDRSVESVLVNKWRGQFEAESIEALATRVSGVSVCVRQ